jgi:hypothetical protein
MNKKAQQEIVGFVLIVIIVVIALLIYMVIKAISPADIYTSTTANNILESIIETSTQCKISSSSDYATIGDIMQYCYKNKYCSNIDTNCCDLLNSTLKEILDNILETEATINTYEINYTFFSDDSYEQKIFFSNGTCLGTIYGSDPQIKMISGNDGTSLELKICIE